MAMKATKSQTLKPGSQKKSLPPSIIISGHTVTIKYIDTEDHEGDQWGDFNIDKDEIRIWTRGCDDVEEILIHEIMHAVIGYSGLTGVLTDEQEEAICRLVQYQLYPLLILNPSLLR